MVDERLARGWRGSCERERAAAAARSSGCGGTPGRFRSLRCCSRCRCCRASGGCRCCRCWPRRCSTRCGRLSLHSLRPPTRARALSSARSHHLPLLPPPAAATAGGDCAPRPPPPRAAAAARAAARAGRRRRARARGPPPFPPPPDPLPLARPDHAHPLPAPRSADATRVAPPSPPPPCCAREHLVPSAPLRFFKPRYPLRGVAPARRRSQPEPPTPRQPIKTPHKKRK